MISNIRRYKGTDSILRIDQHEPLTELEDWKNIHPVYQDYVGDVLDREHPGAQSKPEIIYINETGRNDIDQLKLVSTSTGLLFYVNTVDEIRSEEHTSELQSRGHLVCRL